MGRTRKDCPVCKKKGLLRLPNHLRDVHGVDPQDIVTSDPDSDDDGGFGISHQSDTDTDVDDGASCSLDDDPWEDWVDSTLEQFRQRTNKRVAELMTANGMGLTEARKTTSEELLPEMNKELRKKFLAFLKLGHRLKMTSTYKKIMDTARRIRLDDGMDWEESVTYAVKSRKLLLDRVLQQWTLDWGDDTDNSDDESDEDETEEMDDEVGVGDIQEIDAEE